ncbi:hypothetical protein PMAYCL1PPCAC_08886, partial [Pristionchus mayeri]
DDPSKVPASFMKSVAGVIVQVGSDSLVSPDVIEKLKERGLKKMETPAVSRSVTSSCKINIACAVLPASLNPIVKMYMTIKEYAQSNSLPISPAVEFYTLDSSRMTVHFPLDNKEE